MASAPTSSIRTQPTWAAPNSGLTTAGRPTVAAARVELVQRAHARGAGRRQPERRGALAHAHLAARVVDRLDRVWRGRPSAVATRAAVGTLGSQKVSAPSELNAGLPYRGDDRGRLLLGVRGDLDREKLLDETFADELL